MPCRSPLTGYRKYDGSLTFTDRKGSMGRFGLVTLRCGMCRDCRLYKAREWAIRCYHESSMHQDNCWLTLTYETDPCSIAKRDLQLFFKRLRKTGAKFRYFACGEYGEKLSRPHYHVCLFGHDFTDKYPWKRSKGGLLYRSETLEKCWKWGHALISQLTLENAGYTARYTMKKITGDIAEQHYKRDFNGLETNVTPEFTMASKHPALGLNWLRKNYEEVFPADEIIYNGKPCPVPHYYCKWLQAEHPKLFATVQAKRTEFYKNQEYETGLRMHQAAQSRDNQTKLLNKRDLT